MNMKLFLLVALFLTTSVYSNQWTCTAYDSGWEEHFGGHPGYGYSQHEATRNAMYACRVSHPNCYVRCQQPQNPNPNPSQTLRYQTHCRVDYGRATADLQNQDYRNIELDGYVTYLFYDRYGYLIHRDHRYERNFYYAGQWGPVGESYGPTNSVQCRVDVSQAVRPR